MRKKGKWTCNMKLLEELKRRITRIDSIRYPDEDKYEFFTEIASKMTKSPDLSELHNSDLLIALLAITNEDYPFEKITDVIYDIADYIDYVNIKQADNICILLDTIENLKHAHLLDGLLECKEESFHNGSGEILQKYTFSINKKFFGENLYADTMENLENYITIGLDIFPDYDTLCRVASLLKNFDGIAQSMIKCMNYRTNYDVLYSVKKKPKNIQESILKESYEMDDEKLQTALSTLEIEEILSKIRNYDAKLERQKTQFEKQKNKKRNIYNKTTQFVSSLDKGKIVEIPYELLSNLKDDSLANEIIEKALQNNRSVYFNLRNENRKKDQYDAIEKLFYKYKINVALLEETERNKLMQLGNHETLESILSRLQDPNWEWLNPSHPMYTMILLHTNISIIDSINKIIKQGIIPMSFFQMNPEILLDENIQVADNEKVEGKYKLFFNNMQLLNRYELQLPSVIKNNIDLLLSPNEELLYNIELTQQYQMNLQSENAKIYGLDLLNHSEYFDDVDAFIELGYKDIIVENPQLLRKNTKQMVTRLSIAEGINLETLKQENRFAGYITNGKNFYVNDENLQEYEIYPVEKYVEDSNFEILKTSKRSHIHKNTMELGIIAYLDEQFKISELEYQIQDVIISRMKVLRNMECLLQHKDDYDESSIALSAIIYHSVIDNSTIEFIREKLSQYTNKVYEKKTYHV